MGRCNNLDNAFNKKWNWKLAIYFLYKSYVSIYLFIVSALQRLTIICKSMVEGGLSEHCLIWASGMLPPKLGHIIGCLAFTEYFFVKNKTLPRSNHFLKIQLTILPVLSLIVASTESVSLPSCIIWPRYLSHTFLFNTNLQTSRASGGAALLISFWITI